MPFPPRLRGRAAPELRAAALHRLRVLLGTGEPDEGGLGADGPGGAGPAGAGPAEAAPAGAGPAGTRDEPTDETADEAEAGPAQGSRRARFGLDGRAALVLAVLASAAVVLGGLLLWRARPSSVDVGPAAAYVARGVATVGVEGPSVDPASAPDLFVDVQGRVRDPGVVRLPAGSRVLDALRAAGGPRGDTPTSSLNLARPLVDGEQVVLAPEGAVAGPVAGAGGPTGGPVDLNAATLADLDGLPGVGPVLAQRILDFRGEHGRFNAVEELREVPGIGPSKFAALRAKVRV